MTDNTANAAGTVRDGEELAMGALLPWLLDTMPELRGKPEVTQFTGGASNWTYRLKFDDADLVLRRPPAGTRAKSAHDMGREYRLQQALAPVFPYVPAMRGYTDDETIIGAEFYVMDRVRGHIPRRHLPSGVELNPSETRQLCDNLVETLAALHSVDYRKAGLANLGAGDGYVRRQIEGWSKRYAKARTWNVPSGTSIMLWLHDNMPTEESLCLTHNDFRFDNVVLDIANPTRIVGVLDWELATIGDPFMDLGNMLAYWIEAGDDWVARATRRQPTTLAGMMLRQEVIDRYCARMGRRPANMTFYSVYGLFRLSVIAQQIYYRYHHKQTRNPAFRHFWFFVHYLHRQCKRRIHQDN